LGPSLLNSLEEFEMLKEKELYRLNLQYFSEGEEGGESGQDEPGGEGEESKQQEKALTMEDVQKLIQAEADKVRTKAAKEKKTLQDELDATKTANMTAEQKAKHDLEKLQNEVNEKAKALQERENKLYAIDELRGAELDNDFLPFVLAESDEITSERVQTLKSVFMKAVAKANENTYKDTGREFKKGSQQSGAVTKEQFDKMTYQERTKLFTENRELYNQLAN
jgi:hypothetical protein